MLERRDTHWGAIAFTVAVGIAMATAVVPLVRAPFPATGPVAPEPQARLTPAPADRPPVPVRAAATPLPDQLDAEWLRQTAPPVIFVGQVTTIAILFRNTGTVAWVKGSPAEARLGLVGDDLHPFELGMAVEWPYPTRPAVQQELVVEPGGSAQFDFRIKGTVAGRYLLPLALVVDGVAWMNARATVDVTVQ